MKIIILIFFVFLSIRGLAQDTAVSTVGKKIPVNTLSLLHPLLAVDSAHAGFDSARYYMVTFGYNGTNDSLVITFLDGTRFAVVKPSGGVGAGSGWKTVNTNDMTDTLSGNVAVGNNGNTPKAKLQVSNSGLGTTISDSSKGILLNPSDTAISGNQVWSPPFTWQASQYLTTPGRSYPVTTQARQKSIQGTTALNGYLSFMVWKTLTTYNDDVFTVGINPSSGTGAVGFGMAPSNTAGAIASFNGTIYQASGTMSVPGTWNINAFGIKFIDLSQTNKRLTFLPSPSTWNVATVSAPFSLGKETNPTNGAQIDIDNPGRATLISRGTQAQRDSINLTITGFTVANGGTGYTGLGPNITVSSGPIPSSLTTASISGITWVITGGALTSVTSFGGYPGSYNSTPTITLSGGGGSGAVVFPVMTQVLTEGMTYYCTDCTATDSSTGVLQVWNGSSWKNAW